MGRTLAAFACSLSADGPCLLAGKACQEERIKTDASSSSKDGSGYDTVIKVLGCNAFAGLFHICRAISRLHVITNQGRWELHVRD